MARGAAGPRTARIIAVLIFGSFGAFMFVYGLRQYLLQRRPLRANSIVTGYASREAAAEVLQPYPVGATVRALVDPSMPDKAFLLAEAGAGPVVFMIVGAVTPPVVWWVGQWL